MFRELSKSSLYSHSDYLNEPEDSRDYMEYQDPSDSRGSQNGDDNSVRHKSRGKSRGKIGKPRGTAKTLFA
jgi:hypothetical protein